MEFFNLARYFPLGKPSFIPPFAELRKMRPVRVTQDLTLVEEEDNLEYAEELANRGITVAPVHRQPPARNFVGRQEFPRRILFEMTSKCNYMCRMCPQTNLKRPRINMPGELYRRVLDEIDYYGIEGLWLYHLGESLLHPEWRQNIAHIKNKKNLGCIWMSTNGRLLTEEYMRLVLDSNITYINFSAHAVTEETYDTVAPPGNFVPVQQNLQTLYHLKGVSKKPKPPYLHVQMIEQETTRHEVDPFIAYHYNKADIVSINMLEYVNLANNSFGNQQRDRKPLKSCTRVSRGDCFICSNGSVTLCDAAYNGEIHLGSIKDKSLHEIWNGSERRKILDLNAGGRMTEVEFCRSCTDYDI